MHTRELAEAVGPWRAHHDMVTPPDEDFTGRASTWGRTVGVRALTVFKPSATLRPYCYVEKPDHEQAVLMDRVRRQRTLVHRELAAAAWTNRFRTRTLPHGYTDLVEPLPPTMTPGWKVRQYRRIRGLE
jgi:hypothetical protein